MASLQSLVSTNKSAGAGASPAIWPKTPEIGEVNVECQISMEGGGNYIFPCLKELRSTFGLDYAMTDLAMYNFIKNQFKNTGYNPDSGVTLPLDLGDIAAGLGLAGLKAIPGEEIATGILRDAGRAVNPHSGMVFNSVKPRVFSYTFECIARSASDMSEAQRIFKELKSAALPEPSQSNSVYWKYPKKFKLSFPGDSTEMLPKTLDCHITDLDFNFTGNMGSYVTDKAGNPLQAIMTLTLAEIELIDRKKIDDGDAI